MKNKRQTNTNVKYALDEEGRFVIEDYNQSKPFSNFFPGIAGLWGIPMWVFYVNRGQCIASFGIETKDKTIAEFHPANKSYRVTSLQGFRTFIKASRASRHVFWEPFQTYQPGTDFRKKQILSMSAHDLTLREINFDLGLEVQVNYFALPEEPFGALVRRLTIINRNQTPCRCELIDGLPAIVPFGLTDTLMKTMSRTVEAWVKVRCVEKKTPYYQLNVEISDKPEVRPVKEGNFFFSFDPQQDNGRLLPVIVQTACIFGEAQDLMTPVNFLSKDFQPPKRQQTSNRTPCAMSHAQIHLQGGTQRDIVSIFGFACTEDELHTIVRKTTTRRFIEQKAGRNKAIIDEIKNFAFTASSARAFDLYVGHTFLDNVLRGGLPISLRTVEGETVFNIYSRKHGDLERDYNYFVVPPTFYSQGNGNYRDVNQNRRNDVWFSKDVQDNHVVHFFNLIQADGYNPLIVKGTVLTVKHHQKLGHILRACLQKKGYEQAKAFLKKYFTPGELLSWIYQNRRLLKVSEKQFFQRLLEVCQKKEVAQHGEGFWTDHWTYNLDLLESYLALYPEKLKGVLFKKRVYSFYQNTHYILPRGKRYVLTARGVRQYHSVADHWIGTTARNEENLLRIQNGRGKVYFTYLVCKILCLIANKAASLDPSGIGIEMEADKPNWYDALNGLPGLLGSSIAETFELKRFSQFLLDALNQLALTDQDKIYIFEELASFISALTPILSSAKNPYAYWVKSNELKEHYRQCVREGIEGKEAQMTVAEIKMFLQLVIARTQKAIQGAKDHHGFLRTYFYHEVTRYEPLNGSDHQKMTYVRPLRFKRHALPLFLEGYVHALRIQRDQRNARQLYSQIRKSGLFDQELKMYKVNADLSAETEEIGRTRVFPKGWLENESIWLHMEYKFLLELLRCGLYKEFYENFWNVLIPFLNPQQYGRSILENSSFIVSSAHEDKTLHGQGFVARLSGSTAELLHMWLWMNVGHNPFVFNENGELVLRFKPVLPGWLFTEKPMNADYYDSTHRLRKVSLPKNTYAFRFLGSTLVVYHNPRHRDTFGAPKPRIQEIHVAYPHKNRRRPIIISSDTIPPPHSERIRNREAERIDVYFQ